MPRYLATVVVTLHFDDGRAPVESLEQELEFTADAEEPEDAWEEFLLGSSLDMVEFPDGVDPFDAAVVDEQWEHRSIRRSDRRGSSGKPDAAAPRRGKPAAEGATRSAKTAGGAAREKRMRRKPVKATKSSKRSPSARR